MKYNANFPGTLTPLGVTVRAPWASTSPNSFRPGQLVTLDAGSTLGAMGYPANGSREDIDNYFKTVGVGASISWGEVAEWLGLSRTAPRTTIIEALRRILRRACECHSSLSLSARVCLLGLLHLVEQRQPTGLARARLALRAELAQSNLIPLAATTETPDEPMTMRNLIAALGIDVATVETKAGISTAAAVGAIKKALHGDDSQFGADDFADMLGLSRTVGKAGVEARLRELASIAPVTLSAQIVTLGVAEFLGGKQRVQLTGIDRAIAAHQNESRDKGGSRATPLSACAPKFGHLTGLNRAIAAHKSES